VTAPATTQRNRSLTVQTRWLDKWRNPFFRLLRFLLVAVGSLFFVVPTLWMISTSVKPDAQVWLLPPVWIPERFVWENYTDPWNMLPFPRFYLNTVIIVVLSIIGIVTSSSLIAFGFARLRFPGSDILFLIVLSTLMLPSYITLIPQYVVFSKIGWVNTILPLVLPTYFGGPFNIFLLRQYMMTIPRELDDAAKIDGAGFFGIYRRIILPLSRPALGVVAVNSTIFHWNDFIGPLIYLQKERLFTISLGLRIIQGNYFGDFPVQYIMAMTFVSIIPIVILFFFAQKYLLSGIVLTSFK
jgi:multiple sugar transport system permease protein